MWISLRSWGTVWAPAEWTDGAASGDSIAPMAEPKTNGEERVVFDKVDMPFLIAAFASFLVSVGLWFMVNHDYGLFVGLWVPSILILWVGVRVRLQGGGKS